MRWWSNLAFISRAILIRKIFLALIFLLEFDKNQDFICIFFSFSTSWFTNGRSKWMFLSLIADDVIDKKLKLTQCNLRF